MASKQRPGREARKPKQPKAKKADSACKHPIGRRIRGHCMVCGVKVT